MISFPPYNSNSSTGEERSRQGCQPDSEGDLAHLKLVPFQLYRWARYPEYGSIKRLVGYSRKKLDPKGRQHSHVCAIGVSKRESSGNRNHCHVWSLAHAILVPPVTPLLVITPPLPPPSPLYPFHRSLSSSTHPSIHLPSPTNPSSWSTTRPPLPRLPLQTGLLTSDWPRRSSYGWRQILCTLSPLLSAIHP